MPVNKVAPFQFSENHELLRFYDVNSFDIDKLNELYSQTNPALIFCSGWMNKMYLNFCKLKHKKTVTVIGFDTQWVASPKQLAGLLYARLLITPYFNYAFVPGESQAKMAKKIGFRDERIIKGFYSSDVKLFNSIFKEDVIRSKVLLFVGRYAKEKGIMDLCEVFIDLKSKGDLPGWQLWCVGVGDFKIPVHKEIRDLGFKQPHELKEVMKEPGIFILPSTFEPWGVVVHEFAAAGFPMICSDKVGSTEVFLVDGKNGFLFKAGNKHDLIEKIKKMCNLNPETLKQMSRKSYELSQKITPATWAQSLYNLIK